MTTNAREVDELRDSFETTLVSKGDSDCREKLNYGNDALVKKHLEIESKQDELAVAWQMGKTPVDDKNPQPAKTKKKILQVSIASY